MKKLLTTTVALALVLGMASVCFAALSQNIRIAASINPLNNISVTLSRVVGDVWTVILDLITEGMDFGTLVRGADGYYRSPAFFVVDASITTNYVNWQVTHTVTPFENVAHDNLDYKTNVTFRRCLNSDGTESALPSAGKLSYGASNGVIIPKADLDGYWLRIYYGLAGTSGNASGVTPITDSTPAGDYVGTVTLTLAAIG